MANQTAEEFYQEVESFAQTEVAPGAEAREKAGEIDHALIKKMGRVDSWRSMYPKNSVVRGQALSRMRMQ